MKTKHKLILITGAALLGALLLWLNEFGFGATGSVTASLRIG